MSSKYYRNKLFSARKMFRIDEFSNWQSVREAQLGARKSGNDHPATFLIDYSPWSIVLNCSSGGENRNVD
jgi:hypothetical protein